MPDPWVEVPDSEDTDPWKEVIPSSQSRDKRVDAYRKKMGGAIGDSFAWMGKKAEGFSEDFLHNSIDLPLQYGVQVGDQTLSQKDYYAKVLPSVGATAASVLMPETKAATILGGVGKTALSAGTSALGGMIGRAGQSAVEGKSLVDEDSINDIKETGLLYGLGGALTGGLGSAADLTSKWLKGRAAWAMKKMAGMETLDPVAHKALQDANRDVAAAAAQVQAEQTGVRALESNIAREKADIPLEESWLTTQLQGTQVARDALEVEKKNRLGRVQKIIDGKGKRINGDTTLGAKIGKTTALAKDVGNKVSSAKYQAFFQKAQPINMGPVLDNIADIDISLVNSPEGQQFLSGLINSIQGATSLQEARNAQLAFLKNTPASIAHEIQSALGTMARQKGTGDQNKIASMAKLHYTRVNTLLRDELKKQGLGKEFTDIQKAHSAFMTVLGNKNSLGRQILNLQTNDPNLSIGTIIKDQGEKRLDNFIAILHHLTGPEGRPYLKDTQITQVQELGKSLNRAVLEEFDTSDPKKFLKKINEFGITTLGKLESLSVKPNAKNRVKAGQSAANRLVKLMGEAGDRLDQIESSLGADKTLKADSAKRVEGINANIGSLKAQKDALDISLKDSKKTHRDLTGIAKDAKTHAIAAGHEADAREQLPLHLGLLGAGVGGAYLIDPKLALLASTAGAFTLSNEAKLIRSTTKWLAADPTRLHTFANVMEKLGNRALGVRNQTTGLGLFTAIKMYTASQEYEESQHQQAQEILDHNKKYGYIDPDLLNWLKEYHEASTFGAPPSQ